jgi:HSP20 family protein
MADLMRWSGRDLRRAQTELDGWFNSFFGDAEGLARVAWPKADIYEDQEGVTLRFEVPGIDASQVKVQLNNNTLTVSGEKKLENEERKANYHRIETSYGSFERSFVLPQNLDTEKLVANSKNGMLQIFVPRSEKAKPRSIQVKVNEK